MIIGQNGNGCALGRLWEWTICGALWALTGLALADGVGEEKVDFNREVRRILSDNCYKCHGPDARGRKGGKQGLRLDTREGATADLGGYRAITPGDWDKSELGRRISKDDLDDKMPPPASGKKLTLPQIAILKRWVEQGAEYTPHWSYIKPRHPAPPLANGSAWCRNPIDHFVLARLEKEGLKPAVEADRYALDMLRRLDNQLEQFLHSIRTGIKTLEKEPIEGGAPGEA